MKLRTKALLATGTCLGALFLIVYYLASSWVLTSYAQLEAREAKLNVDRVRGLIGQQLETFHRQSLDWSNWDDTYQFISDRNKRYIESNLATITLKVDTMLFVGKDGKLIYVNPAHRTPGVAPPDSNEIWRALKFDQPVDQRPGSGEATCGFIQVHGLPMMVTVRPVSMSTGKGRNGWIVFALWFDSAEIAELSRRSHMHVDFLSPDRPVVDASSWHLVADGSIVSVPQSESRIAAYASLPALNGGPLCIIRASQTRVIYTAAKSSVAYLVWCILVFGILLSAVVIGIMEFTLLGKMSLLSRQVESLNESDPTSSVSVRGNDELAWLAQKITGMIERVRSHQNELTINNRRLAETINELGEANSVLENAVEGIAKVDQTGAFISYNAAFAQILGYRPGELNGRKADNILVSDSRLPFLRICESAVRQGKAEGELEAQRSDGASLFVEVSVVRPVEHEDRTLHIFLKDIDERKCLERRIAHQAFHDALTNLPNRLLFVDRLCHAQSRAKRQGKGVGVLFLDLDNFKIINDSLGHEAGDELLKVIADRLKHALRPEDTIGRIGGDEFTVLLEDLHGIDEAIEVADRIVADFKMPFNLSMGEVFAGTSIGVAYASAGDYVPEDLLRDADTAMYQAKTRGRLGYVVFEQSMNAQAMDRLELETGLRTAVERNELEVDYQPIVDLESGSILGTEVLIRWQHPVRGRLMPGDFISVAEESGLIVPIGEWVLETACRQTLEWQKSFPSDTPLSASVNLSGKQLQRVDIVDRIRTILDRIGFDPKYLKLEITETVILSDLGDAIQKLRRLKDMGIQLAIDDFGTGYSSISNLSAFPVDSVKIDREFVSRMGDEGEVDAIIAAIIFLSKTMRLQVTAEGLEDRNQMAYLQALGCHSAQGYYFAHPMSSIEFEKKLEAGFNVSEALEGEHRAAQDVA
jgi:diguanylate cyclase (GGDEF)-like protein/PAS domain S-box-containing protein